MALWREGGVLFGKIGCRGGLESWVRSESKCPRGRGTLYVWQIDAVARDAKTKALIANLCRIYERGTFMNSASTGLDIFTIKEATILTGREIV